MRITGDGIVVGILTQKRVKTRVSTENISKISRRFMECRQDSKGLLPQHDAITETETFDTRQNPASAYRDAPLGIFLLRLFAKKELSLSLNTDALVAQAEESLGSQSLQRFTESNKMPKMENPAKLIREFGMGWTGEYLTKVGKLKENEVEELGALFQRVTVAHIFALIAAFGLRAFTQGPLVIFQECRKKQSLQHTLAIMIGTYTKLENFWRLWICWMR